MAHSIDDSLTYLEGLQSCKYLTVLVKEKIQNLKLELRFLRTFICFAQHLGLEDGYLKFASESVKDVVLKAGLEIQQVSIHFPSQRAVYGVVSEALAKTLDVKRNARAVYCAFSRSPLTSALINYEDGKKFLDSVGENLKDLLKYKPGLNVFERQYQALEPKLKLLKTFLWFRKNCCIEHEQLRDFSTKIISLGDNAACLSYFCWVDMMDEEMMSRMIIKLSELLEAANHIALEAREIWVRYWKCSNSSLSSSPKTGELVAEFVDFLFEDLSVKKDQIQKLRLGLNFLINFLLNPPQMYREREELMLTHMRMLAKEVGNIICSFHVKEIKEDILRDTDVQIAKLIEKAKLISAEVRLTELLQCKTSLMGVPNGQIESLLEGLEFLRTFVMDPPKECTGDGLLVLTDVEALAREAVTLVSSFGTDDMKKDNLEERNFQLSVLLQRIKLIKVEEHLMEVVNQKVGLRVVPMGNQIKKLQQGIRFLITFLMDPPKEYPEDMKWIFGQIEPVAIEVVSFVNSFHVSQMTENIISEVNLQLPEKIKLVNTEALLLLMMSNKASLTVLTKDQSKTLHLGLRLLRVFLICPPEKCIEDGRCIQARIEAVLNEVARLVCSFYENEMKGYMGTEVNLLPFDLLETVKLVKVEIRDKYVEAPESSWSNWPTTPGVSFIDFLLRYLHELRNQKADSVSSVKCQIEIIQEYLELVRPFLISSEGQHAEEKDLRRRVLHLAYRAEYVVNSFLVRVDPLWLHLLQFSDVIEEIKLVKSEFENEKIIGWDAYIPTNEAKEKSSQFPTSQRFTETRVVGFVDEAKRIVDHLCRGSYQCSIVSIVGMPGIGKTTLAKKVFQEFAVRERFHLLLWCYVSQQYEKRTLLLEILHQVRDLEFHNLSDDDLELMLYQSLKQRRYLIVLDDIWDVKVWDDLKICFPEDNNGSRILLTSRLNFITGLSELNFFVHHLRPFSDDESWELLQQLIFQRKSLPPELEQVGKEIASSCKGIPLVVTVVAGFLARTGQTKEQWKQVAESATLLAVEGEQSPVNSILELSYQHLPDHLKSCWLFFGAFLGSTEIPAWRLINIWIAEGLVCQNEHEHLEFLGKKYLKDLIGRNLVIISQKRFKGRQKAYRIHDLFSNLCKMKAEEEHFCQLLSESRELFCTSDNADSSPNSVTLNQYRLRVDSMQDNFIRLRPSGPRLRTMVVSTSDTRQMVSLEGSEAFFISYSFKLLRVLDFGSFIINGFPTGVEGLVLLRYLAFQLDSNSDKTVSIPASIAKLCNLETFIVKVLNAEVLVPDSFWTMLSLRNVEITDRASFVLRKDGQPFFSIDVKDRKKAFSEKTQLYNLQTLSSPCLFYGEDAVKLIRRLPNLVKLRCIFMDSWDHFLKINHFPALVFLNKLKSLEISYRGTARHLSSKFNFPSQLKKLTLSKFRLSWDQISTIAAQLPNLEVLKLLSGAFDGPQWYMKEGEFPKLKSLKLEGLNIVEWDASEDSFSHLERLVLQDCRKLAKIPHEILEESPTLQIIVVQRCTKAVEELVMEIQECGVKVLINSPDQVY